MWPSFIRKSGSSVLGPEQPRVLFCGLPSFPVSKAALSGLKDMLKSYGLGERKKTSMPTENIIEHKEKNPLNM